MALTIGHTTLLTGDVTQLKAFGAKSPSGVEEMLGYHAGRLSRGYWICLLVDPLTPGDFEFSGNTLRSGGKLGAPKASQSADNRRSRVHSQILYEYGEQGYRALQERALLDITATGGDRIAKVVPVTGHMKYGSPAAQYPMGGGSLQWTLIKPGKTFLVAAYVDAQAQAHTPAFTVSVAPNARYDDRARLRRYLEEATA